MRYMFHRDRDWEEQQRGSFDAAVICPNGHTITAILSLAPEKQQRFCSECGEPTIQTCAGCGSAIRGYHSVPGVGSAEPYIPPRFCHECGRAYPWTERRLTAAKELALELEELSQEERLTLAKSLDDLVKDSPATTVATTRFKRLVAKAGKGAAEGFRELLVNVLSEAARKAIWP